LAAQAPSATALGMPPSASTLTIAGPAQARRHADGRLRLANLTSSGARCLAGIRWLIGAMLTLALAACGGGGSDADDAGTPGAATTSVAVAAGGFHSLALKSDGSVWAWGGNGNLQLGRNSTEAGSATPAPVLTEGGAALTGVAAISAGLEHSVALKTDGSLLAWGRNNFGQLGDGTATSRNHAVAVRDAAGNPFGSVVQVSAGYTLTAAVKADGSVWYWGWSNGLSDGLVKTPTPLLDTAGMPVGGASRVAVGEGMALILKTDGTLWTWGNLSGGATKRAVRVETAPGVPLTGITRIAAGWANVLALTSDGKVLSWGGGHLGRTTSPTPALVPGFVTDAGGSPLTGVVDVQVGQYVSVLAMRDGTLRSFGDNQLAVLGAGSTQGFETYAVPVREVGGAPLGSVTSISLTNQHVLVTRQGGSVWGWGRNTSLQLARPVNSPADYAVPLAALVLP
jgi:alpha-tubulin suppressor-like RCC1 family protein